MTSDGPGERPNNTVRGMPVSAVLDLCDRIMGEIGRRSHMFGWLRAVGDDARWLTVDAYYPSHRLVVICRDESGADGELCAERIPAHGMRLLSVDPAELGPEADRARTVLEARIAALGAPARRPRQAPVNAGVTTLITQPERPAPKVRQRQAEAARRAARFVAARPPTPVKPVRQFEAMREQPHNGSLLPPEIAKREAAGARVASARATEVLARLSIPTPSERRGAGAPGTAPARPALGASLGIVLVVVIAAEVYFGVGKLAIGGGHVLLAFGLALDACARALGAVAGRRAGDEPAAWWCVLGGSPFVSGFALFAPSGPVTVEPARLAGFVALAACGFVALWLAGAVLGI